MTDNDPADDVLPEVLAMISEIVAQADRLQEAVSLAQRRLPKPSRAELEAMREGRQAVPPTALVLVRLGRAFRDFENGWSALEGLDAEVFDFLTLAFAEGHFPEDLLAFDDLARAAGHGDLVRRVEPSRALEVWPLRLR
jgi:hypothetical protein